MKRAILVVSLMTAGVLSGFGQATTFYYPQIADGLLSGPPDTIWTTTLFVTNPAAIGTSTASVTVELTKSNGTALNLVFRDENGATLPSGNFISFQISGGQTRRFVSSGGASYQAGFATVTSNVAVTGTAVFSKLSANRDLLSEAGVPAATAYTRQAIIVDTTGGFDTGFAYANPSTSTATLSFQLLNTLGVVVRSTANCGAVCTLAGRNHNALFVSQIPWASAAPQMVGSMQITSQVAMPTVALRFSSLGVFTTLPPVGLASIFRPALEWLQDRPWGSPFAAIASLISHFQARIG